MGGVGVTAAGFVVVAIVSGAALWAENDNGGVGRGGSTTAALVAAVVWRVGDGERGPGGGVAAAGLVAAVRVGGSSFNGVECPFWRETSSSASVS